jgi:hypothetical protein
MGVGSPHLCGQLAEDGLADVLPAALLLWIELNVRVSVRTNRAGVVTYYYYILAAALCAFGKAARNSSGTLNTRGPHAPASRLCSPASLGACAWGAGPVVQGRGAARS